LRSNSSNSAGTAQEYSSNASISAATAQQQHSSLQQERSKSAVTVQH